MGGLNKIIKTTVRNFLKEDFHYFKDEPIRLIPPFVIPLVGYNSEVVYDVIKILKKMGFRFRPIKGKFKELIDDNLNFFHAIYCDPKFTGVIYMYKDESTMDRLLSHCIKYTPEQIFKIYDYNKSLKNVVNNEK